MISIVFYDQLSYPDVLQNLIVQYLGLSATGVRTKEPWEDDPISSCASNGLVTSGRPMRLHRDWFCRECDGHCHSRDPQA